jgi:TRAP-type transport system periplasmic protein
MVMKKALVSSILMLISLLFIFQTGSSAAEPAAKSKPKPITLKAIIAAPYRPGGPGQEYVDFCKRVTERAKGELIIDFKGGAETMPVPTQFEAIKKGIVDMGWLFGGMYQKQAPEIISFNVSGLSPDEERKSGYYDFLIEVHNKIGMHYVGRLLGEGFVISTVKKSIKDPRKDFQGLKTAVVGTMFNDFLTKLGAVPTMVAPQERYTAFERGVVDGDSGGATSAYFMGYSEVLKYTVDHRFWTAGGSSSLMRPETWNGLPKHLQDLIRDEQLNTEKLLPAYWDKVLNEAKSKNKAKGMNYIQFSPADAQWYLTKANEAKWEELKGTVSESSYAKLRDVLKK